MEPVSTPEKKGAQASNGKARPAKKLADPSSLEQDPGKKQHGKGKLGSLENPEVYENVPGHVIPILEREFDDFDTEAGQLPARASRPRSSSSASASSRASTASASPTCR